MSDFMADLQMEVFKRSISEEKNSVVKPGLPIVLMGNAYNLNNKKILFK